MIEALTARIAAELPDSLSAYGRALTVERGGSALPPVSALRDRAAFDGMLDAFAGACGGLPGRYDRRALASYWTQYYLAALVTPALTALLRLDCALPLTLDDIALATDADGRPTGFVVLDADAIPTGPGLAALIDGHLAPLFDLCHAHTGLAPRVLWCNAGVILDYVTRELCREPDGPARAGITGAGITGAGLARRAAVREEIGRLLAGSGPCATCVRNPRAPTFRPVVGQVPPCRRVCCLRCRLPGVLGCGALCPAEPVN